MSFSDEKRHIFIKRYVEIEIFSAWWNVNHYKPLDVHICG
jgi:hypothetical protein